MMAHTMRKLLTQLADAAIWPYIIGFFDLEIFSTKRIYVEMRWYILPKKHCDVINRTNPNRSCCRRCARKCARCGAGWGRLPPHCLHPRLVSVFSRISHNPSQSFVYIQWRNIMGAADTITFNAASSVANALSPSPALHCLMYHFPSLGTLFICRGNT